MNAIAFESSISAREPGARLVYADWLAEHGDTRGEAIQRAAARLESSAVALSGQWLDPISSVVGSARSVDLKLGPVPTHIARDAGQWSGGSINRVSTVSIRGHECTIVHSMFAGKDMGYDLYVPAELAVDLLPPETDSLPWAQQVVLAATRGLKSSYAGIKDYRFAEATRITGITRAEYDSAKNDLIARKLLNKAGAITPEGRNAIGRTDLRELRPTAQV